MDTPDNEEIVYYAEWKENKTSTLGSRSFKRFKGFIDSPTEAQLLWIKQDF
jgi:hypothetical protein